MIPLKRPHLVNQEEGRLLLTPEKQIGGLIQSISTLQLHVACLYCGLDL